MVLLVYK